MEKRLTEVAVRIDKFMKDFDPHMYRDCIDDDSEKFIEETKESIRENPKIIGATLTLMMLVDFDDNGVEANPEDVKEFLEIIEDLKSLEKK